MLYNHDVIRLQQKPNISSTRFPGLPTLVTEHAWYFGGCSRLFGVVFRVLGGVPGFLGVPGCSGVPEVLHAEN